MDTKLVQDVHRFFTVYQSRTADLISTLPPKARVELEEELELLQDAVLKRLREATV